MSLGQHLGADQNLAATVFYPFKQALKAAFAAGGVAIDTNNFGVCKALFQGCLDTLGASTEIEQVFTLAGWTALFGGAFGPTVMTAQTPITLVVGHVSIAALAIGNPATVVTHQGR